jgi:outer membrane protein assembly factor BamB
MAAGSATTRALWATLALLLALPALPVHAEPAAAPQAQQADPARAVLDLAAHPDAARLDSAVSAFLQRADGPYAARDVVPPESIYRAVDPVCDLNGDGHPDIVTNDMQLRRPGEYDRGASTVRALSGADGSGLWAEHNLQYVTLNTAHGYSNARPGQPNPQAPPNVRPTLDVNGDGVCDVLAFGYTQTLGEAPDLGNPGVPCQDVSTPLIGNPSMSCIDVVIRMLDGHDGATLWTKVMHATQADTSEGFFNSESTNVILGFPTGIVLTLTPHGPRLLVKTTDVQYAEVDDFLGLTGLAFGGDELYATSTTTGEHLLEANATDGSTLWTRDFNLDPEASHTNITWVSGFDDITGDGEPDVVMDQLFLANPRGREAVNPLTGEALYRNGRGMRMLALDGKDGAPLWSTVVVDPGAVQVPPSDEANVEVLAWNFGSIVPDFTGDGHPDPVAQYMTEEFVGGTPNGRHRTHFVPLDGLTGTPLWNHPQQGWGFLTNLGPGPRGPLLAAATLDVPAPTPSGAAYGAKSVRIMGLGPDGTPTWTFEAPFAQDSSSSYEIGLHQIHDVLAPADLDGDGVRDPVTPAQYERPAGPDQVFLATARQHFQVLSGATGKRLQDLDSWGSNGLLLPCSGRELTFAVGHAKRIDLERFDAATGALRWRVPIWSFAEPRSSTASLDLVALDGVCADVGNRTAYGVNLEAFSFFRRYEIIPLLGMVDGQGAPQWQLQGVGTEQPRTLDPAPPAPSLLETLAHPAARFLSPGMPTVLAAVALGAIGVGAGLLLSKPVAGIARRRRRRLDPLGIALMLILVPGAAVGDHGLAAHGTGLPDLAAGGPTVPAATHAAPAATPEASAPPANLPDGAMARFLAATRDLHGPGAAARLARAAAAYQGAPDVSDRFGENDTLSYPYNVGDQDGDGVDDVALDVYCISSVSCFQPGHPLTDVLGTVQDLTQANVCGPYHRLVVLSGASGGRMWDAPLDTPHPLSSVPLTSCAIETVLGTVPLPDGTGILVYRFEGVDPADNAAIAVNHTVYLLDAATGTVRWRFSEPGFLVNTLEQQGGTVARSLLMNPMLTLPEKGRTPDRTAGAGLGLVLQGIGYSYRYAGSLLAPPGFDTDVTAVDDYQPIEWLARLDPQTGQVLWRADSFQPQQGRSVLPFSQLDAFNQNAPDSFADRYYTPEWLPYIPAQVTDRHWGDTACCGDLTGDGVSDPVFTTLEWNPLPNARAEGPYRFDAHVVAFDGATGARLWDRPMATDVQGERQHPNYYSWPRDAVRLRVQAVGDASGDGAADVLVSQVTVVSDYRMDVTLLDGRTGQPAWSFASRTAQAALPLGDANGDKGNDILFFDWYDLEHLNALRGDYTNVTSNPLRVRSGHDGSLLYTAKTVSAPLDLVYIMRAANLNGPADLDGDGVGDIPTDDPVFLPDQVTLHQVTYLSGRDGHALMTIPATGAFAYPVRLPDITGDGKDDVAVLSGDANDLWLAYHDGQGGQALWSHRALALKTSSYSYAVPRLHFTQLRTGPGPLDRGFLLNLHMDVQAVIGEYESLTIQVGGGESGTQRYLSIDDHVVPQIDVVLDPHGRSAWSYPASGDPVATRVDGDTPGTVKVLELRGRADPTTLATAATFVAETWIPAVALLAGLAGSLAVAVAVRLRRSP